MMETKEKEEQELLTTFEKGEWKKVEDMDNEIKKHMEYAKATPHHLIKK